MKQILKNWKTTSLGLVAIVLLFLTQIGSISPSEQTQLSGLINEIIEHVDAIIAAVLGIALILSKDVDAKE